ncbi:MAG: small subunit ribosomal protein S27Ae [Candidatus Woesearchaeota archaeon]|jgi:small subunit ribosomal protein S27Ae
MADKKKAPEAKKKKPYHIHKLYEVNGDKVTRKNKWSPKLGEGFFMANHKDRDTCGSTGYMEKKSK